MIVLSQILLKLPIISGLVKKQLRKEAIKFCEKTKNWRQNDWIAFIEEKFNKSKTVWTLKNFPWLKDATVNDLIHAEENKWVPPPSNYPATYKIASTGTIQRKIVPFSKKDMVEGAKWIGWLVYNMVKNHDINLNNFLTIFAERQFSELASKLGGWLFAKKTISVKASEFKDKLEYIAKKGPYDAIYAITSFLPMLLEFIKTSNIFDTNLENVALVTGGTILTPDVISEINTISKEHNVHINITNVYGSTEIGLMASGSSIRGFTYSMAYMPTHIGILKLENGKKINVFKAPKGARGEYLVSKLGDYMIPNYAIGDIVEIENNNSALGLPIIRVLGRGPKMSLDISLPKIGEIHAYGLWFLRIPTCSLSTFLYLGLLQEGIKSIFIVEDKGLKADLKIVTSKPLTIERFKELVLKYDPDFSATYLIELIDKGITEVEILHDPQVVDFYYNKGAEEKPQSGFPPILLLKK